MADYSLTLSNDSAQVEQVQHGLESYLGGNGVRLRIATALNLALGEWLENIIHHAQGDGTTHSITPSCLPSAGEVLRICGMEKLSSRAECIQAARRWVQ